MACKSFGQQLHTPVAIYTYALPEETKANDVFNLTPLPKYPAEPDKLH